MYDFRARFGTLEAWLQLCWTLVLLALGRLAGDRRVRVDGLLDLGKARGKLRQFDEAERSYESARLVAAEAGYALGVARGALGLATVALLRDDWEAVVRNLEPEVPWFRDQRDPKLAAYAFMNLGVANEKLGRIDPAKAAYSEALQVASKTREWSDQAWALRNLGGLAFKEEQYSEAQRYWKEALKLYKKHRKRRLIAEMEHWLAYTASR